MEQGDTIASEVQNAPQAGHQLAMLCRGAEQQLVLACLAAQHYGSALQVCTPQTTP